VAKSLGFKFANGAVRSGSYVKVERPNPNHIGFKNLDDIIEGNNHIPSVFRILGITITTDETKKTS
jgi:hypothetical protein